MEANLNDEQVPDAFRHVLPSASIETDHQARCIAASDIAYEARHLPACILTPENEDQVTALVRVARSEGISLHQRGGGWSYTNAHAPQSIRSAIVNTDHLKGINFDGEDSVDVAAGVTWAALHDVVAARGQRVPSFGPLSGIDARVGSTLANDGAFFGGAGYGAIGERSVSSVTMIDGCAERRLLTLEDAYDPVLAPQPLAGDCGAFGIKTRVRLRLIRQPERTVFASFAFQDGKSLTAAMSAVSNLPGLGEVYSFDQGMHENLIASGFSVLRAGPDTTTGEGSSDWASRIPGLECHRAVVANLEEIPWALHASIEGSRTEVTEIRAEFARRIASFGGAVIPDVIPRVTRAKPFRQIKALVTAKGERWLSSHGLVEAADGVSLLESLQAVLSDCSKDRSALSVRSGFLVSLIGRRITVEPQLYWPDSLSPYLRAKVTSDQLQRFNGAADNPAARALAFQIRDRLISVMDQAGAGHFQIGRTYASHPGVPREALELWRTLKLRFDPDRIMNPGALGL